MVEACINYDSVITEVAFMHDGKITVKTVIVVGIRTPGMIISLEHHSNCMHMIDNTIKYTTARKLRL